MLRQARFCNDLARLAPSAVQASRNAATLSKKGPIIKSNTLRKMKRGLDRLPSQGPDPASQFKHGWRMAAAAVLERYPVVIPYPDPFEAEYQTGKFLDQQSKARPIDPKFFLTEKDVLEGKTEPSLDDPLADMYKPAPRITEADKSGDQRSLKRALDERLYFVVKRSAKSSNMQFPQVMVSDPEVSLREYTRQALNSVIPAANRPEVHHISYTPTCHLEHVFSPQYQEKHDVYGVKIFFFRVMLMSGEITAINQAVDYKWLRDSELEGALSKEYYNAIEPMLVGVGPY